MAWLNIENTQAVAKKLKSDLAKIYRVTDIIIQLAFLLYYTYLSIANLNSLHLHIIYALFLIAGIAMLIYNLVTKKLKVNKHKKRFVKKVVRYIKYPVRISLIAIALYQLVRYGGTRTAVLMVSISIALLVIQVIVNLIIRFVTSYVDYFQESLKMDYEESDLIRAAVNSRKNPSEKKPGIIASFVKNTAIKEVDKFVEENKDSVPLSTPTPDEVKIRNKIISIREKHPAKHYKGTARPVIDVEYKEIDKR